MLLDVKACPPHPSLLFRSAFLAHVFYLGSFETFEIDPTPVLIPTTQSGRDYPLPSGHCWEHFLL